MAPKEGGKEGGIAISALRQNATDIANDAVGRGSLGGTTASKHCESPVRRPSRWVIPHKAKA